MPGDANKPIYSETLIIATAPVVAYAAAFAFKYGYLSFYGLPLHLVSVTLDDFFAAAGVIGASLMIILNSTDVLPSLLPQHYKRLDLFGLLILFALLDLFVLFVGGGISVSFWWLLGVTGFYCLIFYVLPIFPLADKRPYLDKLAASFAAEAPALQGSASAWVEQKLGPARVRIGWISIIFVPYVAYLAGSVRAETQTEFLTLEINGSSYVQLALRGDAAVYMQVDPKTDQMTGSVLIRPVASEQIENIALEKLGRLHTKTFN